LRLAFVARFPTLPFWDFLGVVQFGVLLRDHGLIAPGFVWAELNPGAPLLLSILFRLPADPVAIARIATAVATGLVGGLPFLLWRRAVAYRWRLLAGLLLALWPGQVFFSGVVAQDNWVLLPVVALAALAVAQFVARDSPRPVVAGLLYVAAVATRQDMMVVLLPLLFPAAIRNARSRRRSARTLILVVAAGLATLLAHRYLATGRLALTTESGALSLSGSFMPGSAAGGWVDSRAFATALHPESAAKTYGSQRVLLGITLAEIRRRPMFHALRVASWPPRLALTSDADNLQWSLSIPQAQPADRQVDAGTFARSWEPLLLWELAIVQGLFVAACVLGIRRRRGAILVLAASVVLKYLIHALMAPVGRAVVPATAIELLAIAAAATEWTGSPARSRAAFIGFALAIACALRATVSPLAAFVVARDSRVLPGVGRFTVRIEGGGSADCRLERGAIMELGPKRATFGTTAKDPLEAAKVSCVLPRLEAPGRVDLILRDPTQAYSPSSRRVTTVTVDGRERARVAMVGQALERLDLGSDFAAAAPVVEIELSPRRDAPTQPLADAPIQFDFARR